MVDSFLAANPMELPHACQLETKMNMEETFYGAISAAYFILFLFLFFDTLFLYLLLKFLFYCFYIYLHVYTMFWPTPPLPPIINNLSNEKNPLLTQRNIP
jgi:hypothetical protein